MAYDLSIYGHKNEALPTEERVRLLKELRTALDAAGSWYKMSVPETSGATAKWFLENDGFFDPECKTAFQKFCTLQGIEIDPLTEDKALSFMIHQYGIHLATVSLPSDAASCAAVFRAILSFARHNDIRVLDPQAGKDTNLEHPGEFPDAWK